MEPSFWHNRWQTNQTGWHERDINPLLAAHFPSLHVPPGGRVFVPLCGKSLDLGWLLSQGYAVAGAELSELAVTQLFAELRMEPTISEVGKHKHFRGEKLDIFVGDLFDLSREVLGSIDAVYDRAALVALPHTMRERYTAHLKTLAALAPQLVIGYEYDQTVVPGPPFSVTPDELHRHYGDSYALTPLARLDVSGGLKGKCPATEHVWKLNKRHGQLVRHETLVVGMLVSLGKLQQNHFLTLLIEIIQYAVRTDTKAILGGEFRQDELAS